MPTVSPDFVTLLLPPTLASNESWSPGPATPRWRHAGAKDGGSKTEVVCQVFLPACFCVRGTPDARCRAQTPPLKRGIRTFPQVCPKSGVGWGNRTKSRTGKSSISPSIPRLTETRVGKVGERLGNVTHSPTGLGNSWDSPIFPRPLPHTFPKRIAGWECRSQGRS